MIITGNLKPYGLQKLKKFEKEDPKYIFERKVRMSKGAPLDLDKDLKNLISTLPAYEGQVFGPDGKKTKEYKNFKKTKVRGVWFVEGQMFRPLKSDYHNWDGHILLDLD